ncbi:lytic transglycosylase domain-containing protein [Actinoallomurus purpureus]|uniref:lytic transglycosylase domain-containing protein n=1 Tax=Actinoallomurus purpureus TaxID=478114 RepID=UPI002093A6DE|nr:lytic transglycosylase domain-containing protein [Actinoallomurus purpureus]MCO6011125.1 lytic transglycosylase domain-containing protein [Actinoallomurus purpureus]
MRRFVRRGLPAAVAAIALAATATAASGAVYLVTAAPKTAHKGGRAAGSRDGAGNRSVTTIVPTTEQPAALKRVVDPDFLVVADRPVTAGKLREVSHVKRVRDVITVDAGAVQLQGGRVNMFAVDPSAFRSWTPPGTAKDDGLWNALAQDRFVVSGDVQQQLGLREAMQYPVLGRTQLFVTMGGSGSLGLPGINVLVGRETGRKIGLVHDIAFLVNAPGADLNGLGSRLRRLVGAHSQVIDLHQSATQPQGQPARQQKPSAGRPGTYLALYQQSAGVCAGLSWTVLAAIGQIESDHGRNAGPSSAGALGPMQFMPATWRIYGVDGDGDGKADIMNPYDAVPAAAKYLCASGAGRGGSGLSRAVWAYNHSQTYVDNVLSLARAYARRYS